MASETRGDTIPGWSLNETVRYELEVSVKSNGQVIFGIVNSKGTLTEVFITNNVGRRRLLAVLADDTEAARPEAGEYEDMPEISAAGQAGLDQWYRERDARRMEPEEAGE